MHILHRFVSDTIVQCDEDHEFELCTSQVLPQVLVPLLFSVQIVAGGILMYDQRIKIRHLEIFLLDMIPPIKCDGMECSYT